jgi:hypothetical protein
MKAYSEDLRRKIVEAVEKGTSKREFCKRETETRALHAARTNLLSISLLIAP